MTKGISLIPEWAPQEAMLLSWPDSQTDWAPWLADAQQTYLELLHKLNQYSCPVILLVRQDQLGVVKALLNSTAQVLLLPADYNDTWIRDYGFLTVKNNGNNHPVSFTFNGWGQKFEAGKDNHINELLLSSLCQNPMKIIDRVLEGGAVEIDAHGTLLSTESCLTNTKRNGTMSLHEYNLLFRHCLGAVKSVIFEHGQLDGDDTDGHIDTLVRFTPDSHLVVQSAYNRPDDPHYPALKALLDECQTHFPQAIIYQLPLPEIFNCEGERLPASYANFLLSNQHVFAPIYQTPEDNDAMNVLANAFPEFQVIPVDCRTLVQQFGSLHCISMQVPTNTLKSEVLTLLQAGVTIYE